MKKLYFYAQIKLEKSYDGTTDKFRCIGIYNSLERAKKDTCINYDFVIEVPEEMVKKHLPVIIDHIIEDGYCAIDEAEIMTNVLFPFQYHNILKGV